MADDCAILGYDRSCTGSRKVGGAKQRAFLARRSELEAAGYTVDADGNITDFSFETYEGFVLIYGRKLSASGSEELVSEANNFYNQTVVWVTEDNSAEVKAAIKSFRGVDDIIVVLETSNQEFELYGKENGLKLTVGTRGTGTAFADDTSWTLNFTGAEVDEVPFVTAGTYATTVALLEGYVV